MQAQTKRDEAPRLITVSLSKDVEQIWIRFKLDRPIAIDSAPLMFCLYIDGSGENDQLQLGLTVARRQLRRYFLIDRGVPHLHELDGEGFALGQTVVVVPFDAHWLASVRAPMTFSALLMYDAADVQGSFPVSVLNELA